jgi:uncharacterized protein YdhG (YjbR/CyaY superfamily)
MEKTAHKFEDITGYIEMFPSSTKTMLKELRKIIKKAAPSAEETISYNMPTFNLDGYLVYFAGYKNHIGFYPMPSAVDKFSKELSVYKTAKGSVQFPLDEPLPSALITRIVKFRVKENQEKAKLKKKKKK